MIPPPAVPAPPLPLDLDGVSKVGPGVWRLPALDAGACRAFSEAFDARCRELERAGTPPQPPNSMHDGGAALDAIGWTGLFDRALDEWLRPLAAALFPDCGGATIDSVYGFIADYGQDADSMLGYHADDASVTVNLCLGGDFVGSELYFRGARCALHRQDEGSPSETFYYEHEPGVAIVHAGANRHGVEWIDGGRRRNLILWLRSSSEPSRMVPEPGDSCPDWCVRARGGF